MKNAEKIHAEPKKTMPRNSWLFIFWGRGGTAGAGLIFRDGGAATGEASGVSNGEEGRGGLGAPTVRGDVRPIPEGERQPRIFSLVVMVLIWF